MVKYLLLKSKIKKYYGNFKILKIESLFIFKEFILNTRTKPLQKKN